MDFNCLSTKRSQNAAYSKLSKPSDSCGLKSTHNDLQSFLLSKENLHPCKRKRTPEAATNYTSSTSTPLHDIQLGNSKLKMQRLKNCNRPSCEESDLEFENMHGELDKHKGLSTQYDAFKSYIERDSKSADEKPDVDFTNSVGIMGDLDFEKENSRASISRKKIQNGKSDNSTGNGVSESSFFCGINVVNEKVQVEAGLTELNATTLYTGRKSNENVWVQRQVENVTAKNLPNLSRNVKVKVRDIDVVKVEESSETLLKAQNCSSNVQQSSVDVQRKLSEQRCQQYLASFERSECENSFEALIKDWVSSSCEKQLEGDRDLLAESKSRKKFVDKGADGLLDDAITREMAGILKSSEYRKDVQLLFDKVETSICDLGPESKQDELILDKTVLNVSGITDKNDIKNSLDVTGSLSDINWNDDSFLTSALLNMSSEKNFTSIMKKALLENAHKLAVHHNVVNSTVLCSEPTFVQLGGFYGLPDKVKGLMKMYRGIETLYDWQHECLTLPAIESRTNLVYALPTSGGKTLVAEILMLREVMCRKKNALFVLPFVAIVQEKVWGLSPFAVALDFLVEEYAAGKGSYPPRKRRRKNSVYVATIEKGLGLVNSLIDAGRLDELGLVVIDELHLIGSQGRGTILESLLTKIMFVKDTIQIIGMSATIGNLPEICQFLEAEIFTQNFRPVELTEYVKCENHLAEINWNGKDADELFTFAKKIDFGYSDALLKLDPDMLGGLIMEVVPNDSCLMFCPTKKNCENVASLLCNVMFVKLKEYKAKEKEALKIALRDESGSLCNILSTSIPFGVAYHHSGLTSDERRLIEDGFRAGVLSVICCTSTLAAGVNLPAKRVILRQPYIGKDFINLSRYKQMVGRAGRAGFGQSGESILITNKLDLPKVTNLLLSPMDQVLSSMHEDNGRGLMHLLLSCISLGIANTRLQLQKVANRSLLGVQQERLQVNIKKLTDSAIKQLFKLAALKINHDSGNASEDAFVNISSLDKSSLGDLSGASANSSKKMKLCVDIRYNTELVISKLGLAAIKGGLELSNAHVLYEDILQAQASLVLLNCLHLLYLVTPYDICEQIRPFKPYYYTLFTQLKSSELQTAKVLGITESCALKMLTNQSNPKALERTLNRFYVTLMLYDLWNEVPVCEVSEKYQVSRGIVQNLMTSSASFASNVVNFCSELEEFWAFAHLLKGMTERLQCCCVKELKQLMELPSVKQSRAKQLYSARYRTLASVARADPNDLMQNIEYMSRRLANELIAAAKLLLLERVENLREEAEDVLDGIEQPKLLNYSIAR